MAADGVVKTKLKELVEWTGISRLFTSDPSPTQPTDDTTSLVLWDARDPPTNADRANLTALAAELEVVGKRIARIEEDIAVEENTMREMSTRYGRDPKKWPPVVKIRFDGHARNKKANVEALRQAFTMRTSLQSQMHTLQNAASQRSYMRAMRGAHSTLTTHVNETSVDEAESLIEDQRELEDRARELTRNIARPQFELDDDDLADELDELFAGPVSEPPLADLPDVLSDAPESSRNSQNSQNSRQSTREPVVHTKFTRLEEMLGE